LILHGWIINEHGTFVHNGMVAHVHMVSHGHVVSAHAIGNQNSSDHRAGVHMLVRVPFGETGCRTLFYCLTFGNFRTYFGTQRRTGMASHGHARSTRTTGNQNNPDNRAAVPTLGMGPAWRNWVKKWLGV